MPSSPDNVDMERLKRDIPKFLDNSRVITDAQKSWWTEFFANAGDTYGNGPEKTSTWLLDDLQVIKNRAINAVKDAESHTDVTTFQNQELTTPPNIAAQINNMVQGPLGDIPEV